MGKFLLMTEKGNTPPKIEHDSIESAITEAKRLNQITGQCVKILEIIGTVDLKPVPVVKLEQVVTLDDRMKEKLPF